jgi:competence protein ComFC
MIGPCYPGRVLQRLLNLLLPTPCPLCNRHLVGSEQGLCQDCCQQLGGVVFDGPLAHLGGYRPHLVKAVERLKFGGGQEIAVAAGLLLAAGLAAGGWQPDAITFVPLHPKRQQKRGFNQAERLAQAIRAGYRQAGKTIPVLATMKRQRETEQQAKLAAHARGDNVRGAFTVAATVRNLDLLLVDDVYTTGNTLGECSLELVMAGAKRVRMATIARAYGKKSSPGNVV